MFIKNTEKNFNIEKFNWKIFEKAVEALLLIKHLFIIQPYRTEIRII